MNQQVPACGAAEPKMDTFDLQHTAVSVLPPPAGNASLEDKMEFIRQQLDDIGLEKPVLNGLLLLGNGVKERIQGGVRCLHTVSLANTSTEARKNQTTQMQLR